MKKYDFIGIGDITNDAFISLNKKSAHIEKKKDGSEEIHLSFGDKVEYDEVTVVKAVGNSANASVSASRQGLKTALVSNVGADDFGKDCITSIKKEKVDTRFMKVQAGKATNYHYVLNYGPERTILVKHEDYTYSMPNIGDEGWIYLSSIGEKAVGFHKKITEYVNKNKKINLVYQPGTFQIKLGYEKLKHVYKSSTLFFCNVEESQRILKTKSRDVKLLLKKMKAKGPKIVSITDGRAGAYAYDGKNGYYMPMYPDPKPPVERTGAGDSFASTFTGAMARGKNMAEALEIAPINSMNVVQHIGAQEGLLPLSKLNYYFRKRPKHYKLKKII